MQKQAEEIASWNKNIIIKVPITNTKGESTKYLIKNLTDQEIPLNITAIFTINQIKEMRETLLDKLSILQEGQKIDDFSYLSP